METTTTVEQISALMPEAAVEQGSQFITITIPKESYAGVVKKLKEELSFDFFLNMTGVDYQPELGIVLYLRNSATRQSVVVHTSTGDRENPSFDTISDMWKGAGYFEREIYDLLGVKFNNHPDLRRMFLEDEYPGYPLRKDFVDPYNPTPEK